MRVFECEPQMEIKGNLAISLLTNLQAEDFQPYLISNNLVNIDPERWYPFQNVLNVFRDVAQTQGSMFDFVAVGMAAVERYKLPPEVATLTMEQFFLKILSKAVATNYRNGETTIIEAVKAGDKHLRIRVVTPYPDDTAYGFIYGFARRFLPSSTPFRLAYDDTTPRRDFGGEETMMHLTWE